MKKPNKQSLNDAKRVLRSARAAQRETVADINKQIKQQKRQELKAFRHSWTILKRKGLVKGDARKVKPSKKKLSIIGEFQNVITGKERAFKVKPRQAKSLREQGITVRNGRAVVANQFIVRNGKVFRKRQGKSGTRIHSRAGDLETIVRQAYKELKPKYGLAFRLFGNGSYRLFPDADTMIQYLSGIYAVPRDILKQNIEFFDPKQTFQEYQRQRSLELNQTIASAKARKNSRRSAKTRGKKSQFWVDAGSL